MMRKIVILLVVIIYVSSWNVLLANEAKIKENVTSSAYLDIPHMAALWSRFMNKQIEQEELITIYQVDLSNKDEFAKRNIIKQMNNDFEQRVKNDCKTKNGYKYEFTAQIGEYNFKEKYFPLILPETQNISINLQYTIQMGLGLRNRLIDSGYTIVFDIPEETRKIEIDENSAEKLMPLINKYRRKVTISLLLDPISASEGNMNKNVVCKVQQFVAILEATTILKRWKSSSNDKKWPGPRISGLWTFSRKEVIHSYLSGENMNSTANYKLELNQSRTVLSGKIARVRSEWGYGDKVAENTKEYIVTGKITENGDIEIKSSQGTAMMNGTYESTVTILGRTKNDNNDIIDAILNIIDEPSDKNNIEMIRGSLDKEQRNRQTESTSAGGPASQEIINRNINISGGWKGIYRFRNKNYEFKASINMSGNTFEGNIDENTVGIPSATIVDGILQSDKKITFAKVYNVNNAPEINYSGEMNEDGTIQGVFKAGSEKGTFSMQRIKQ